MVRLKSIKTFNEYMYSRKRIQHIVMDLTGAYTELCELGKLCGIDKSPYNQTEGGHRHPYTAVYSTLFAPLKNKPIMFAEIGVAGGGSVVLWWKYFKNARLSFFDRDQNFLDNVNTLNFPENKPYTGLVDVRVDGDIGRAIMEACIADTSGPRSFDVVLDDSSHDYEDQIRIIKECWPHINPGGYMIVEDVFRSIPESNFEKDLESVLPECADAYFVVCNHEERYSPGWNNDKLLVLVKA